MTWQKNAPPEGGRTGREGRGHTASGTRGNSTANSSPAHPEFSPAQRLLDRLDWSLVRGQPVFCAPPQGFTADQGHLRELGMQLAAAGASVVQLFDGERVVADWWANAGERPRGAA